MTSSSELTIAAMDSNRVFQRDTDRGNPAGFNTKFDKGWGEVDIKLTSTEAGAVRLRLRDSADPTKVIQDWTDWPAPVAVGLNTLKVNVPAGLDHYVLDIALASAPSSVATSTPFGVGTVAQLTSRSSLQSGCSARSWSCPRRADRSAPASTGRWSRCRACRSGSNRTTP